MGNSSPSPGGGGSPPKAAGWGDLVSKSPTIKGFKRRAAKRLRDNATGAETVLWRHLKRLEMKGTHFRRQMPIGKFIVDFVCPAARLVIEVDGSQHGDDEPSRRDERRTQWLEGEGYRVLRFWNNHVTQNTDAVMQAIYVALYGEGSAEAGAFVHSRHRRALSDDHSPHPARFACDPPPPGEGEE